MHKTNIKYFCFLAVAVVGFFVFTGGITGSSYDIFPPQIDAITTSSTSPQVYDRVTFTAMVTNSSKEIDDCTKKSSSMSPDNLSSRVIIMKGTDTISTGQYTYHMQTNFTYDYVFSYPGEYTIISEFTSSASGYNNTETSSKTISLSVKEGSIPTLQPGTFTLVGFRHISTTNSTPFVVNGAQALGNSYLTIRVNNTATMHTNVTFDAASVKNYPALTQNYKYDVTGKWLIERNAATGLYDFRIEYNNSVYAAYNYTYDGSMMNLSYKDKDNNEFTLTFSKN
jgi:hypothetical protein